MTKMTAVKILRKIVQLGRNFEWNVSCYVLESSQALFLNERIMYKADTWSIERSLGCVGFQN